MKLKPQHLSFLLFTVVFIALGCRAESSEVGYFWHVTDPHVDFLYKEGSEAKCDQLMCCRDVVPNPKQRAGKFGSLPCDPPLSTFKNALEFVKSYPVDTDFIFYGGDSVPHDLWMQNRTYNLEYVRVLNNAFLDVFGVETPVVPILGNHDTFPVDQVDPNGWSWLLDPVSEWWSVWLPRQAVKTLREKGWYSLPSFRPGLTIICLYTQYEDPINFYLYENLTDPAGQMAWLEEELTQAEKIGNKVFLFGHIPPGQNNANLSPESLYNFNVKFSELVERFSDTIRIQLYGHTHTDAFRVITDLKTGQQPKGFGLISPAVTPWQNHNPAVRLIKYSRKTFDIMDVITFYADLEESNAADKMLWRKEYSMSEEYGLKNITAQGLFNLSQQMWKDDNVWAKFVKFYPSMTSSHEHCQGDCRALQVCASQQITMDYYSPCVEELAKIPRNEVKAALMQATREAALTKTKLQSL